GGSYYFTRTRSSVVAFTIPYSGFSHFQIISSHSDSPAFKLKPNAGRETAGHYAQLNTEKYGGMLMSTWFDRPLSIAGRIVVKDESGISTRLVNVDRDIAMIPNMPIHFNRSANEGVNLSAQTDMLPVYGTKGCQDYMELAAESAGVDADSIVGSDLFLYSRSMACVWGADEAYFSAGRIDDLECAYTSLRAFITARMRDHINVLCVLDNEEVGSSTKQGADSTILSETFRRIALALGAPDQALEAALAGSFMVSADNAHAVHPNHPEKYDQDNRVYMNEGVVVKFNANQKYTSDGMSAAVFEQICKKAGIPTQHFANHSDAPGGTTLGNIANTHVSMNTVDIGLAQLAMHSAYETAGVKDVDYMIEAMRAFFETEIEVRTDGEFTIA
ncbi:MAG: M18 family aminopeptidase, partial [Clostridia bacterium]|nr:M18 family aminopeptidase [Clostridia bacterium]